MAKHESYLKCQYLKLFCDPLLWCSRLLANCRAMASASRVQPAQYDVSPNCCGMRVLNWRRGLEWPWPLAALPAVSVLVVAITIVTLVAITVDKGTWIGGGRWPYLSFTGRDYSTGSYYVFSIGLTGERRRHAWACDTCFW